MRNSLARLARLLILSSLLMAAPAGLSRLHAAESVQGIHARVSWVAPESLSPAPGATTLGIRFELDSGWHIYWKNPGDSGSAPKFKFEVTGGDAGEIRWPFPERLPYAHLVNLGYDDEVVFPFELRARAGAKDVRMQLKLEWLVCSQDECLPGFATLDLERPVGAVGAGDSDESWEKKARARLSSFVERVPRAREQAPWEIAGVHYQGRRIEVTVRARDGAPSRAPEVFPLEAEAVSAALPEVRALAAEPATAQRAALGAGYSLTFTAGFGVKLPAKAGFVLSDGAHAWVFPAVPLQAGQLAAPGEPAQPLWLLFVLAFAGGVILNLMPCVLPVLSIKLFSLVHSQSRLREGLLYALGVLVAFAGLGAAFLALRSAGSAIGWGFHLQSPSVVLGLVILFWLMGLNFLGVFEMGTGIMSWAAQGGSSSFATGLLSVFVAAPCTGPFMGSALGAAATLPAAQAMLLFVGLGAGLASPFVAIAAIPALAHRLPRPGRWMETLKQFFAFPLFATVLWLLWVLETQTGASGWLAAAALLLLISFALWLGRSTRKTSVRAAWALAFAGALGTLVYMQALSGDPSVSSASLWTPYSAATLAEARGRKQPVFVDFTAAWCITCQVNKKAVLETQAVQDIFRAHQVLLLEADWTRQDSAITRALAEFGRSSLPLYVYYPAGGDPRILPQILSRAEIEKLF
jgi:thiol:disulfide interchange protein DsbD